MKSLDKTVKEKSKEIIDLKKENSKLVEELVEVKTEFQKFSAKVNTEMRSMKKEMKANMKSASQPVELECDKCDFKVGDLSKLKSHLRINHTDVKCTQTDEVELVDQHVQLFETEFRDDKCVQTFEEFSSVEEDKRFLRSIHASTVV